MHKDPTRIGLLVTVVLGLYMVSYLELRSSHQIRHYSNADHWHHEKREPGHSVHAGRDTHPVISRCFKPLMLMEQAYHNTLG